MPEEIHPNKKNNSPWHFWFLVAFSAFIIVTFVYYLPARFLHRAGGDMADVHMDDSMMDESVMNMMAENGIHAGDAVSDMHVDDQGGVVPMMTEENAHGAHGGALFHEEGEVREGVAVNFNISPIPVVAGAPSRLEFFVNQKPAGTPVTDLQIEHDTYMHVIGVRDDMNEFFHIHPEAVMDTPGLWAVEHIFAKPGTYKMWSDVTLLGATHSFGHPAFAVQGEGAQSEKQVTFAKNIIIGDYQVRIEYAEPILAGRETDVMFTVRDLYGTPIDVEPFLAAAMHLAVIKDDWSAYLHTHPEGGHEHAAALRLIPTARANGGGHDDTSATNDASKISFHVIFPEEGTYKLFAQFRPHGTPLPSDESLVAGFYVSVQKGGIQFSGWWFNLIVSLLLIGLMSWAVKRYITVAKITGE